MNIENDKPPRDKHLSSLYRQTEQDMPGAHLDDAILAAARRETASRPRRALGPFAYTWRVPASLAAVLVISFGIVTLMENDLTPLDSIAPTTMHEAEMFQAPLDSISEPVIIEEKRARPRSLSKPAPRTLSEPDRHLPAAKRPPAASADSANMEKQLGLVAKQQRDTQRKEQVARKKRLASVDGAAAVASSAPALARHIENLPTVGTITALRVDGERQQANQAADTFIRYYFGEDPEKADPMQVKLTTPEWKAFIEELKKLGRASLADKLEALMNSRARQ